MTSKMAGVSPSVVHAATSAGRAKTIASEWFEFVFVAPRTSRAKGRATRDTSLVLKRRFVPSPTSSVFVSCVAY